MKAIILVLVAIAWAWLIYEFKNAPFKEDE